MGLHNLPASYDAWRLTPPDDRPARRARFAPADVQDALCIEFGDVTIDAIGTYDAESCALVSVRINGDERSVGDVATALRLIGAGYARWSDDLDPARRDELLDDAIADAFADYADARRDMLEDY